MTLGIKDRRKAKKLLKKAITGLSGNPKIKEKRTLKKQLKEQILLLGGSIKPKTKAKERKSTSKYYPDSVELNPRKRQLANNFAVEILGKINSGEISTSELTDEQKSALAAYTGNGGGLTGVDGKTGSPYEYYTPKPLAEATWRLLEAAGFKGGAVLDPSSGTGIFGGAAPKSAVVEAVELDEISGGINKALNGENGNVKISSFEEVAASTPDEMYDAVITNIPFGSNLSRGGNQFKDTKYQKESLEAYFVLRSLEKLKPGGVAAFISSSKLINSQSLEKVRLKISAMAEFRGAFRLPNAQDTGEKTKAGNAKEISTFAGADVTSDVLVFKKHSRETLDKIADLRQSNAELLVEANVFWQPFITGKYFKLASSKKNIFGKVVIAKNKFGKDVERVISDDSIANISKLMKRLDDSRINWKLIETSEPEVIQYQDGDVKYISGVPYVFRKGQFVKEEGSTAFKKDIGLMTVMSALATPLSALEGGITKDQAFDAIEGMYELGRHQEVPSWATQIKSAVVIGNDSNADDLFNYLLVAYSAELVFNEHSANLPFNFSEHYPKLTEMIKRYAGKSKLLSSRAGFAPKRVSKKLNTFYSNKNGLSNVWMGIGGTGLSDDIDVDEYKYDNLKYMEKHVDKDGFIDIETFKENLGVDPYEDDDWCLSNDGKGVKSADDYYSGNYQDFLDRHADAEHNISDEKLREKLAKQQLIAESRIIKIDHKQLKFNIKSPLISTRRKVEFLNKYTPDLGSGSFIVVYDDNGREIIEYKHSDSGKGDAVNIEEFEERKRNLKRFAQYITKGTFTTGTNQEDKKKNPKREKERVERLRTLVNNTNQQFDAWTRANSSIQEELKNRFSDPKNIYFYEEENGEALDIPGLSEKFSLHDYQNVAVRAYAKNMKGLMGYDVGLGKTAVALSTIEYLQSRRIKKKTLTIVPNSTLSNWKKETKMWFKDTSNCLFVGLSKDKDGNDKVRSADYARDMMKILENEHSKVFMTLSAFEMIPLKEETWGKYIDHMRKVDRVYDDLGATNKTDELKKKTLIAELTGNQKNDAFPFFEDMGFDSLIIDEAHMFKNSKRAVEFKGAKRLSLSKESRRGTDALAKSWYIRGKSEKGDGVLPLTATPITNSPLEMYSMLSLAVGEEELNRRLGGIKGADDFLEMFTVIDETDDVNLLGESVTTRVFTGLGNVPFLRDILHGTAKIKTAEDVNLKIPDYENIDTNIELPDNVVQELKGLKEVYRIARKADSKSDVPTSAEMNLLRDYMQITGETIPLIAHPFNLINKMNKLIIDEDLARQSTVFFIPEDQYDLAKEAVKKFNSIRTGKKKLPITEKRGHGRKTPLQTDEAVLETISDVATTADGDDNVVLLDIVQIKAFFKDGKVLIDTEDYGNQLKFIKLAESMGLTLDASISPKVAAFIEKFNDEKANPKSPKDKPTMAKQIVFCDMLGMHNKLKIIIAKNCGVPANKIMILNGQSVKDPAEMQDIQDSYNAEGDDNGYEVIIANKKAEVGINLQKGTQAIHHLTMGWTPDSEQQRNGRGIRQGNYVKGINVYHYDADGTFDNYKRELVSSKANWINGLVSGNDSDNIVVEGGISKEDADILINSVGDEEAIRKARAATKKKFEEAKKKALIDTVVSNAVLIKSQRKILDKYEDKFNVFLNEKIYELATVIHGQEASQRTLNSTLAKIEKDKEDGKKESQRNINAAKRARNRIEAANKTIERLAKAINNAVLIKENKGSYANEDWQDIDIVETIKSSRYRTSKGILQLKNLTGLIGGYSYGINTTVSDDSEIKDDWMVEVETAKALMVEGKEKAKQLSKDAGIDASRIEGFEDGTADIIQGKIVEVGDFILNSEAICIISRIKQNGNHSLISFDDDGYPTYQEPSVLLSGDVVNRESSNYKAIVRKAASIDNQSIKKRGAESRVVSVRYGSNQMKVEETFQGYSTYNHDVAELIENANIDKYAVNLSNAEFFVLSDAIYPYALRSYANSESGLIKKISESHKGKIHIEGDLAFIKKDAVLSVERTDEKEKLKELVKASVAYDEQLQIADADATGIDKYTFKSNVFHLLGVATNKSVSLEELEKRLSTVENTEEIVSITREYVVDSFPLYKFTGEEHLDDIHHGIKRLLNAKEAELERKSMDLKLSKVKEKIDKLPIVISSGGDIPGSADLSYRDRHVVLRYDNDKYRVFNLSDTADASNFEEFIGVHGDAQRVFTVNKERMRDIAYSQLSDDELIEFNQLQDNAEKIKFLEEVDEINVQPHDLDKVLDSQKIDLEDPLEWVAIIGDTYGFNGEIKDVAKEVGTKQDGDDWAAWSGGKAVKRRIKYPPDKSWIVSRRVYNAILEKYPEEVRERNITLADI